MANVIISYTIGDVFLVRGSKKKKIERSFLDEDTITLRDGDKIITCEKSFAVDIQEEIVKSSQMGSNLLIFPNSEVVLKIKDLIKSVEVIRGLILIDTDKPVKTKTVAGVKYPLSRGKVWVDVSDDGTTVVASEMMPALVKHAFSNEEVQIKDREQVALTKDQIIGPRERCERFKVANKVTNAVFNSKMIPVYKQQIQLPLGMEQLGPEVLKAAEQMSKMAFFTEEERQQLLKAGKEMAAYDSSKDVANITKEMERIQKDLESALEVELPKVEIDMPSGSKSRSKTKSKKKQKITITSKTKASTEIEKTYEINKSIKYKNFQINLISASIKNKHKGRNAPKGKVFLFINAEIKNPTGRSEFIFYDEEIRLISGSNEISLDNYSLETNIEANSETKGFFKFLVPIETKEAILQIGKKHAVKEEINLNFNNG